jgi:hypothetical protein
LRDPLLLTYAVPHEPVTRGPLLYDLSSGLQPMSIRDQIYRGYSLVRRALDRGLLVPGQELPILVIGGGVAGAIASMTAAENNVPAVLIEQGKTLFRKQVPAQHRAVCPTQYDWPAPHWTQGVYPWWAGARMPLAWSKNAASAVAAQWISALNAVASTNSRLLSIQLERKFVSHTIDVTNEAVRATFDPPLDQSLYSLVIACAGSGPERISVPPTYKGFAFWSPDPYGRPNLDLPSNVRPNILISGSGDGSLQDYIRIVCGRSAGEIYNSLPADLKPFVESTVAKIEDASMRSFLWGEAGELDHPIHSDVQTKYLSLVSDLLTSSKFSGALKKNLKALIGRRLKMLSVKLLYPCEHFWSCYALNRFVLLLLSEYIKQEQEIDTLQPNSMMVKIAGLGHTCVNLPHQCHGKDHEVMIADARCTDLTGANNQRILAGNPFNVVIARHGVDPAQPPLGAAPSAAPYRQVIPYSSVW